MKINNIKFTNKFVLSAFVFATAISGMVAVNVFAEPASMSPENRNKGGVFQYLEKPATVTYTIPAENGGQPASQVVTEQNTISKINNTVGYSNFQGETKPVDKLVVEGEKVEEGTAKTYMVDYNENENVSASKKRRSVVGNGIYGDDKGVIDTRVVNNPNPRNQTIGNGIYGNAGGVVDTGVVNNPNPTNQTIGNGIYGNAGGVVDTGVVNNPNPTNQTIGNGIYGNAGGVVDTGVVKAPKKKKSVIGNGVYGDDEGVIDTRVINNPTPINQTIGNGIYGNDKGVIDTGIVNNPNPINQTIGNGIYGNDGGVIDTGITNNPNIEINIPTNINQPSLPNVEMNLTPYENDVLNGGGTKSILSPRSDNSKMKDIKKNSLYSLDYAFFENKSVKLNSPALAYDDRGSVKAEYNGIDALPESMKKKQQFPEVTQYEVTQPAQTSENNSKSDAPEGYEAVNYTATITPLGNINPAKATVQTRVNAEGMPSVMPASTTVSAPIVPIAKVEKQTILDNIQEDDVPILESAKMDNAVLADGTLIDFKTNKMYKPNTTANATATNSNNIDLKNAEELFDQDITKIEEPTRQPEQESADVTVEPVTLNVGNTISNSVANSSFRNESRSNNQLEVLLGAAYQKNPEINAARQSLKATNELRPQALAGILPTVDYGYGKNLTETSTNGGRKDDYNLDSKGFSMNQSVFGGGETLFALEAADAQILSARNNVRNAEQNFLLQSIASYIEAIYAQKVLKLSKNNENVLKEQLRASEERFKLGDATKTDVAQSQARLANATSNRVIAYGEFINAKGNFEKAFGMSLPDNLTMPNKLPNIPATLDEALEIALKKNPSILQSSYLKDASDAAYKVERAALLPQFDVNASARDREEIGSFGRTNDTETNAINLNLTVPLYNGGLTYSKMRGANEKRAETGFNYNNTINAIKNAVLQTWQSLATTASNIEATSASLAASEFALNGVKEEQRQGERTILDVLDAEQERFNAEVNHARAIKDSVIAVYRLKAVTGELSPSELNLPVADYDLEEHYNKTKYKIIGL